MAHYYLDCEHNQWKGQLISMALVRNDGASIYFIMSSAYPVAQYEINPWVSENVMPILHKVPSHIPVAVVSEEQATAMIEAFLTFDPSPHIVADYPDDLKYFNELLVKGPGKAINCPHMTQEWLREDAYPTLMPGAIRHNAWWDAMALRYLITRQSSDQ